MNNGQRQARLQAEAEQPVQPPAPIDTAAAERILAELLSGRLKRSAFIAQTATDHVAARWYLERMNEAREWASQWRLLVGRAGGTAQRLVPPPWLAGVAREVRERWDVEREFQQAAAQPPANWLGR